VTSGLGARAVRRALFWRPRDESPAEVTSFRHPNLHAHNRYFDRSALRPLTGLVWEEGIAAPSEVRRRTAEIAISKGLMAVLEQRDGKRRPLRSDTRYGVDRVYRAVRAASDPRSWERRESLASVKVPRLEGEMGRPGRKVCLRGLTKRPSLMTR
jgi:hypothetical protein